MKCSQCGAENREEAQFCKLCGGRLNASCPACGNENPPDSKFCDGCGQPLANERNSPPIESSAARTPMPAFQPDTIPVARGPSEGERKQVTVLFSDLSGYAALSERLDPEEIKEITSRIFGEVARVVSLYDGFVEKYVGDAVVALFGVPKSHEDDHIRALKAALPHVPLIAAGGVNQLTASNLILAGAAALGVGRELIPKEAIQQRRAGWIHELARRFLGLVKNARSLTAVLKGSSTTRR